jgi:GNAT superfamily N-acetyltransferase
MPAERWSPSVDCPHSPTHSIRDARPEELALLGEIEQRASERFIGLIDAEVAASTVDAAVLAPAIAEGRVLVAVDELDRPVGFAYLRVVEGAAHLEELDVLPESGGRGLGSALLEAAGEWARSRGFSSLGLSTYRDIPFNAPFYLRRGFRLLESSEWAPAQRAVYANEQARGWDMRRRVFLTKDLG